MQGPSLLFSTIFAFFYSPYPGLRIPFIFYYFLAFVNGNRGHLQGENQLSGGEVDAPGNGRALGRAQWQHPQETHLYQHCNLIYCRLQDLITASSCVSNLFGATGAGRVGTQCDFDTSPLPGQAECGREKQWVACSIVTY